MVGPERSTPPEPVSVTPVPLTLTRFAPPATSPIFMRSLLSEEPTLSLVSYAPPFIDD